MEILEIGIISCLKKFASVAIVTVLEKILLYKRRISCNFWAIRSNKRVLLMRRHDKANDLLSYVSSSIQWAVIPKNRQCFEDQISIVVQTYPTLCNAFVTLVTGTLRTSIVFQNNVLRLKIELRFIFLNMVQKFFIFYNIQRQKRVNNRIYDVLFELLSTIW